MTDGRDELSVPPIPLVDVILPATSRPAAVAMADPLRARLRRNVAISAVAVVACVAGAHALNATMLGAAVPTGWALLALMFVLALYGSKKRLPFLPLGSSASWLQFHLYAGLLTVVLFGLHTGMRVPRGPLEAALALLYLAVAGSGVLGIALSRALPPRIRATGEAILFDRIPRLRREIRERAEALVLSGVSASGATTIADIYASRLEPFFAARRNVAAHLFAPGGTLREVLDEVDDARRYANDEEKKILGELKELVKQKNLVDANFAFQWSLRAWLFVHVPLTGALLIAGVAHGVLVQAFRGSP